MARPDFRSQAAERLASERSAYTPALIDMLKPDEPGAVKDVRRMPIDRVYPNPDQPRRFYDVDALQDLASSIREHGILQPVLVRPRADGHYQIVAGERRWRAARLAGLSEIPVIVERIDDEAALEIAIIENLQREDISPLEEADVFERMTREHGYSLRKLATKLGKDKGYLENRLRLVDAPPEIRELVAQRRDTLSHAYELMKVEDPRKRRRLARQVAAGELSLVKLRQRIAGPPPAIESDETLAAETPGFVAELPGLEGESSGLEGEALEAPVAVAVAEVPIAPLQHPDADVGRPVMDESGSVGELRQVVAVPVVADGPAVDDVTIDTASTHLSAAVAELVEALTTDLSLKEASSSERQQFAKYLTLAKIKIENAIAVVRAGDAHDRPGSLASQLAARGMESQREPD